MILCYVIGTLALYGLLLHVRDQQKARKRQARLLKQADTLASIQHITEIRGVELALRQMARQG